MPIIFPTKMNSANTFAAIQMQKYVKTIIIAK